MSQSAQLIDRGTRVPVLVPDTDIRKLPIGPEEAFVFSRVDGRTPVEEIALSTGLPLERVTQVIARLAELGAVLVPGDATPDPTESATRPGTKHDATPEPSPAEPSRDTLPSPEPQTGPSEGNPDRHRKIRDLHERLPELTHYELLGVSNTASKADIKSAYFSVISEYHPDNYYGQDLGELKTQLTQVFQRMTEAHDVLTRARRRKDYDASLNQPSSLNQRSSLNQPSSQDKTAKPPEPGNRRSNAAVENLVKQAAREPTITELGPAAGAAPKAQLSSAKIQPRSSDQTGTTLESFQRPEIPVPTPREVIIEEVPASDVSPAVVNPVVPNLPTSTSSPNLLRQAAARRLSTTHSRRPRVDSTASSNQQAADTDRGKAIPTPLKAQSQLPAAKSAPGRMRGATKYLKQAEEAQAQGNWVGAVNALKLAISFVPEDQVLKQRLQDAELAADTANADRLLSEAKSNEDRGDLQEAARLYGRAARGKMNAQIFAKAAECGLRAGTDLRKAGEYGKQAIDLQPEDPNLHLLLGRIYAAAKMKASALAELQKAAELKPKDAEIESWLKRVQQGNL